MKTYISHTYINDLLSKSNILSIIQNRIQLKKRGKNFFGICPFHLEKHPSFVVSEEKQLYHCFGCGVHGNIIDFIMNYDHINFIESVKLISNFFGIIIPYKNDKNNLHNINKKQYIYNLMFDINKLYKDSLVNSSLGKKAYQYLLNRGFNKKILDEFSIGFSNKNLIYFICDDEKKKNI
ncbi:CHC2 zinc finger domain-containing protein [Enterobacteriaceae endosymbiont of Plateumaris braccata]|uniref:CHC2 zinc finger domain-containing protein n=1 Tax=Enterobacteriaceae endosymbiont of Plateumaris braccata TaxID=2675793 RepID=UPI00144919E4|nr:CHC2 zinc finger domain-containing protein [Enterobacteriaceae endosymbiont of Plateumaris braccata]QJC28195.1 hypothetical protein GJT80_01265 [Enterobacteriaceae endosymbiont of Plateumaris braccata]